MKKRTLPLIFAILFTLLQISLFAQTAVQPAGSGTAVDPYQVETLENLYWISQNTSSWQSHFIQTENIDASETAGWNGGAGFNPIGRSPNYFEGIYDGQEYTISNLTIYSPDYSYLGLFGWVNQASISNVILLNGSVSGKYCVGCLAGICDESTVENCHSSGNVTSTASGLGGLIGHISMTQITSCSSSCTVNGNTSVGGIVGSCLFSYSTISKCHFSGTVSGNGNTGGIIGLMDDDIDSCSNTGVVSGINYVGGICGVSSGSVTACSNCSGIVSGTDYIGGIAGESRGNIEYCCNTGNISGDDFIGGICGSTTITGYINECCSTGDITGDMCIGGAIGTAKATIQHCYSAGNIKANSYTGGFCGEITYGGEIHDSYSFAEVMRLSASANDNLGSFIGLNNIGIIENCYACGSVTYENQTAPVDKGFVAINSNGQYTSNFFDKEASGQLSGIGATPQTTAGMTSLITFMYAGWDLKGFGATGIWNIGNGRNNGYPYLDWQFPSDPPAAAPPEGMGTTGDPFMVEKFNDLLWIAFNSSSWDKTFLQTSEIDASVTNLVESGWIPIGNQTTPFSGRYNGQGYQISGLFVNRNESNIGLFGNIDGAELHGVVLTDVDISGDTFVGAVAGYAESSDLKECACSGNIYGSDYVGGLAGEIANNSIVSDCYSRCGVSRISGATGNNIGAFCGFTSSSSVEYSYSTGSVFFLGSTDPADKGFSGGDVSATYNSNFFDSEASNQTTATGAVAKTTAEMKDCQTFTVAGWDFKSIGPQGIWNIGNLRNDNYPYLSCQYPSDPGLLDPPLGSGTVGDPYLIVDLYDLKWISENSSTWDKHFLQLADIDASETAGWNGGAGFSKIGSGQFTSLVFSGAYDGMYHTIDGLTINEPDSMYVGFFGSVTKPAVIKNLRLNNVSITGKSSVGGLAGLVYQGDMDTVISNCSAHGIVSGMVGVGGLVGDFSRSVMVNCYSSGTVTGTNGAVGGLVGATGLSAGICQCYSTADAIGYDNNAGGFIGYNDEDCKIMNCYSTGSVSGIQRVGGFAGAGFEDSEIINCYSTGPVTGSQFTGGFLGYSIGAVVTGCFWDTQTSGQSGSAGGTGKPTYAMKTETTFINAGWDFAHEAVNGTGDYWVIEGTANNGYPILGSWMLASVETGEVANIGDVTAECGGDVTAEGLYCTVSAKGVVWGTSEKPTLQVCEGFTNDGSGTGAFSSSLTGLSEATLYYVRAYAVNGTGTAYGEQKSFTTNLTPPGNALDFDGSNDYVSCGAGPVITGSGSRTIEAWAYTRAFNEGGIFQAGNVGTDNADFSLRTYTENTWRVNLWGSGDIDVVLEDSKNSWHHYCLAYDGDTLVFYYDGNIVAKAGRSINTISHDFRIGRWYNWYFNGIIDEVRVWNTTRTQQEIRENMSLTVSETSPNLIAYYRFDQTEGTLLPDLTTSGYNGTLYNMNNSDWVAASWPYGAPYVTTTALSGFTYQALTGGGEVISEGSSPVSSKGLLWDITANPVLGSCLGYTNDGTGQGSFVSNATGLNEGTTYFFRAYAINSTDTSYGAVLSYTAGIQAPTKALDFDGVNDYVSIPNEAAFDFTNSMTVEAWIRVDSFTKTWQAIITKGDNSWRIHRYNNTGYITFDTDGTGEQHLISNTAINDGNWHHIAVVYNGSAKFLYIDGRLDNMIVTSGNISTNDYLVMFGENAQQTGRQFDGKMDEVRIYSTALDSTTIREHMHLSLQGTENGLTGYWQFNESDGVLLHDFLNNHHGILMNMSPPSCWVQSGIPLGAGISNTQSETNGIVSFTGTGLEMFYNSSGSASVTVTRIDTVPNVLPSGSGIDTVLSAQYWAVNRYGTGTFDANFNFCISEDLLQLTEENPANVKLFTRASNSDQNWTFLKQADSVNAAVKTVFFNNISSSGQFIIGMQGEPEIEIAGLAVEFGEAVQGDSVSMSFNVWNNGIGKLIVSNVVSNHPDFIVPVTSFNIPAGMDMDIEVIFSPQQAGYYSNTLTVFSNDPDEPEVDVALFGKTILPYALALENPPNFLLKSDSFITGSGSSCYAPSFIDFDRDGLLDLIIGNYDGKLLHYEQQSEYSEDFILISQNFNSIDVGVYSKPCFTDLDGDGLFDLIVGENVGNLNHYEQMSPGADTFLLVTQNFNSIDVGAYSAPTFTDLDNDGLLDLLVGDSEGRVEYYRQQAPFSLLFNMVTNQFSGISVPLRATPNCFDLDDDGLLEILIGDYNGLIALYKQSSANSLIFDIITSNYLNIDVGAFCAPFITDMNYDGAYDLLLGNSNGQIFYYRQAEADTLDFGRQITGSAGFMDYHLRVYGPQNNVSLQSTDNAFSISDCRNSGFVHNLILSPVDRVFRDTVFVRFEPSAVTGYSGSIIHAANEMDTIYITLEGEGVLQDHYPGTALDFDGNNDYVNCGPEDLITGNLPRTIEAWAYARDFNNGGIFQAGITGSNGKDFSLRTLTTIDEWRMQFWGSDTDVTLPGSRDAWHHYCLTYDGDTAVLYYDGKCMARTAVSLYTGQSDLKLGVWQNSYFHGKIDEVRMWDRALDSIEVRERMHLALTGTEPGLAGYWQFNDGSGNLLRNIAGTGDGVLMNMNNSDWVASSVPFGSGYSDSHTETNGLIEFAGTGLSAYYYTQSGAEVTATRIDTIPNILPGDQDSVYVSQYWSVHRYGNGSFDADLTLIPDEELLPEDQLNPQYFRVFSRPPYSDEEWSYQQTADSVNASENFIVFRNLESFGQLLIAKKTGPEIDGYFTALNLGKVILGDSSIRQLPVQNTGGTPLIIDSIVCDNAGFTVSPVSCSIPPRDTVWVSIRFKPQTAMVYQNELTIYSNDADEQIITISLMGMGSRIQCLTTDIPMTFDLVPGNFNSIDVGYSAVPCISDPDRDGLLDMIIGNSEGTLSHYRQTNAFSGTFVFVSDYFNSIHVDGNAQPCFTDLDSDNHLDLIIGTESGNLQHYRQRNEFSMIFDLVSDNFSGIDYFDNAAPVFTDIEGDGLLDLLVGNSSGCLDHYVQQSQFSFLFDLVTHNFSSTCVGSFSKPCITDFYNDGLIDLVIGNNDGNLHHYRQLALQSTTFFPVTNDLNSYDVGSRSAPFITDLDEDGLCDLLVGENLGIIYHFEQKALNSLNFECIPAGDTVIRSYYLQVFHLHDNLQIQSGNSVFDISLAADTGFSQSLDIIPVNGSFTDTVYVRFLPLTRGYYSDFLTHTSADMDTSVIALLGVGVEISDFPGNALDFDGDNDYVNYPGDIQVTGSNPRTIAAWAYARSFDNGGIFQAGPTGLNNQDFSLRTTTAENIWRMQFWNNDVDVSLPGSKDAWHHYCLTYDGSVARLYYDGELMASKTLNLSTGQSDIRFGRWENSYFDGKIDEVSLWDYALDSLEIREKMHLNLAWMEPGLLGYWQFNEGSGNTLGNMVDGSYGTLFNMDNSDWILSTIPFGGGIANSQVETAGLLDFTGTGLTMNFNSQTGAAITVSRIDTVPNVNPIGPLTTFDDQYWVVNRYGTGTYDADITLALAEDLTSGDQNNPAIISLYSRDNTTDVNWTFLASASTVDAATDQATFNGLTVSGQFILAREMEIAGIQVGLTVLLEGPFNGSEMNTTLNSGGHLPLAQPYNQPPWNYTGTEAVAAIPDTDIVDWVLIELRDAPDAASATSATIVARQACFLLKNGSVVGTDGYSLPLFTYSPIHSLFTVIWHRNSIGVMSANALTEAGGVYTWDFTTAAGQAYGGGNAHKELAPGIWGLAGADGNADGQVNNGDKIDVWSMQAGTGGYKSGDFNLDAQVNNGDKNDVWVPNTGLGGQVPDEALAKSGIPHEGYNCQVPE